MSNRKRLTALLTFSLALNSAFVAVWGYHYFFVRPALRRQETSLTDGLEALDLTDQQRRALTADRIAVGQSLQRLRRRSQVSREKLLDLLAAPQGDPRVLEALHGEIAAGEAEARRLVLEHLVRMRDTLNEEQRHKLRTILSARMRRGGRHMRRMRPAMGPRDRREPPGPPEPEEARF